MGKINTLLQKLFLIVIDGYRCFISPIKHFFVPVVSFCQFYPSCSAFAIEAIQAHGALKGLRLILARLIRCHPFCKGGYDPVPQKRKH